MIYHYSVLNFRNPWSRNYARKKFEIAESQDCIWDFVMERKSCSKFDVQVACHFDVYLQSLPACVGVGERKNDIEQRRCEEEKVQEKVKEKGERKEKQIGIFGSVQRNAALLGLDVRERENQKCFSGPREVDRLVRRYKTMSGTPSLFSDSSRNYLTDEGQVCQKRLSVSTTTS